MNQSEMILSELLRFEEKELIVLSDLYKSIAKQHDISKTSFYRAFGRLLEPIN